MPSSNVHRDVTRKVYEILCNNFHEFRERMEWLCDLDINEVVEYSVDPDRVPDKVHAVMETCYCGGKEVDIIYCQMPDFDTESTSRKRRCYVKEKKQMRSARHHGGINVTLWKYYLLSAAKFYIRGDSTKSCWALGRALHYAQDGVLSRNFTVEGVADTYESDVHDVVERALDKYVYDYLRRTDVTNLVKEGVDVALNEKPMAVDDVDRVFEPTTSPTEIAENVIRATAYTYVKFFNVVNYIKTNKERILRNVRRMKLISFAGFGGILASIALAVLSAYSHPFSLFSTLPILLPSTALLITWPLYRSIKLGELYVLDVVDKESILTHRARRGVNIITETYQPVI